MRDLMIVIALLTVFQSVTLNNSQTMPPYKAPHAPAEKKQVEYSTEGYVFDALETEDH